MSCNLKCVFTGVRTLRSKHVFLLPKINVFLADPDGSLGAEWTINMLDKSVPYAGFYMRRDAGLPLVASPLPEGYSFVFYKEGDEASWARIEASVLEFESDFSAIMHFKQNFVPHENELRKRCLFIENGSGEKIATTTAWWRYIGDERRAWMHWVAVMPEYQGQGLGKAIVSKATELMAELEGNVDFYLGTQTWSYKAVGIYKQHGFLPTADRALYTDKRHNYKKAMKILRKIENRK